MRHPADDLPEDRPEHEDEEVRDALTQDDSLRIRQREILMDIGGVYRPGFMTKFQAD